jgi:hypothetical protein
MKKIILAIAFSVLYICAHAAEKSDIFTTENVSCFLSINTNKDQVTIPLNFSKGSMIGDVWSGNAIVGDINYLALAYGGVRIKNELMIFGVEVKIEAQLSTSDTNTRSSSTLIKGKIALDNDQRPAGIVYENINIPSGDFQNIIVACKINE